MVRGSIPVIFGEVDSRRVATERWNWNRFFVERLRCCTFGSFLILFFHDCRVVLGLGGFLK